MDELDKKLFNDLNLETEVPKKCEIIINEALNKKGKHFSLPKLIPTACAIILITTGIVYAKEIKNLSRNIFNYDIKGTQGVEVATNKEYIQNVNMEYIESNNTKFKIDYVTMDDTNLALNFNFLLDVNADGFRGISFYNMKIYDDKNNMIYTEEEKFPNESIALGIGINKTVFLSGNNVIQSFLIESDRFPKTKSLRITFEKITLYNENNGNPITKELNGDFDITVKLDEKFYNRKTITYDIENKENKDDLGLERVFLTDTSFNLIINNPKLNEISVELKDKDGKTLYSEKNIYLKNTNDDTCKKIAKLDATKYDNLNDIMELIIIEYLADENFENVYLYNSKENTNGVYDVSTYMENNQNVKENITRKYILKKNN